MQTVYNHGGRKFVVSGLPPIGCLPLQITASFYNTLNRECVDEQISDTIAYNTKLRNLVPELQKSLPESKIAYLDITDSVVEIIQNPEKYGKLQEWHTTLVIVITVLSLGILSIICLFIVI